MASVRRRKSLGVVILIILLVVLWWFVSRPKNQVRYTITDLGTPNSEYIEDVFDINKHGQVAGNVVDETVIWSANNKITETGERMIDAHINNPGEIAGSIFDGAGDLVAAVWRDEEGLTVLGSCLLGFASINNFGQGVWDKRVEEEP